MSVVRFDQLNASETGTLLRFTSTTVKLKGEYLDGREEIVIRRAKFGQFKVKWMGRIPIPSKDTQRCDLGHRHIIDKDETWVWNYATLSASDAKALAEFLLSRR